MSRIRANQITNQSADGAPTVQNGLIVSGVSTSIQHQATNINVTGVVTATSFSGSGANLTGLASRDFYGFKKSNENLILQNTNGADNITNAENISFVEDFIGPTGYSFSINSAGHLIMTI